jgi:hypothetical protein
MLNEYDSLPKPSLKERKKFLEITSKMTFEQKLKKVFELNELAKRAFFEGLKLQFPQKSDHEIRAIYIEKILKCHNSNY